MVAIASPGSGKTYVMSEKIRSVLPDLSSFQGVIAISYTNKASDELKKRSLKYGMEHKSSFFGTIDRFCSSEIIFPFLPQLWGNPENDYEIKKVYDLDGDDRKDFRWIKENQVTLEDIENHLELLAAYFKQGILFLETSGALALYTLINSTSCQKYIQARYTHIFVDEYQDSGLEQHELFLKLETLGLVAVAVGDANQFIFGFSNKDSKYLLNLAKKKKFKLFSINFNHRCHISIVNYSHSILSDDPVITETDKIRVYSKTCSGDQRAIAQWIDKVLPQILIDHDVKKLCHIGILVRGPVSAMVVNQSLSTQHRVFENHPLEENFDLWSRLFCQLLRYYFDSSITAQEIIEDSPKSLTSKQAKMAGSAIRKIRTMDQSALFDIFNAIAMILLPSSESKKAKSILEKSLKDDLSQYFAPAKDDELQIMTIHKAKGLEFDVVFHLDLYEWAFPGKGPGPGNDFNNPKFHSLDQDTNLHYVAVTRAKKVCFLCTSTKRIKKKYQSTDLEIKNGSPSEFLLYNSLLSLREELKI